MSEMIERVAREICADRWPNPHPAYASCDDFVHHNWRDHVSEARRAIAAMREPTEAMKSAEGVHWGYGCHICGGHKEAWQLLIDEALKE